MTFNPKDLNASVVQLIRELPADHADLTIPQLEAIADARIALGEAFKQQAEDTRALRAAWPVDLADCTIGELPTELRATCFRTLSRSAPLEHADAALTAWENSSGWAEAVA